MTNPLLYDSIESVEIREADVNNVHKNMMPPEGQKLYLVTFELSTGEQKTKFKKGFKAESEESLKKDIERYLLEYYGFKNSSEDEIKSLS